jgi:beta-glucanase (GH16 family)
MPDVRALPRDFRIAAVLFGVCAAGAQAQTPWQQVWADEFNGTSLNRSIWQPQSGTGTLYGLPSGWGNNELQYYTERPQNLSVSGGSLRITARAENFAGSTYTSARIRTPGTVDVLFGRIEARIRIPSGQGIWPAFWMLPTNSPYGGWAAGGEIDIMESTNAADRIYGTIHYGGTWPANTSNGGSFAPGTDFGASYHLYAVEWEPDQIRWYVDSTLIHTATSATWFSSNENGNGRAPFDVPFHLILNIAVGGNFPGPPNGSVGFPMEMAVDYVRVYQRQQLIYTGVTGEIPGQIEAENYDLGGPGVAYLDNDASNNGGQYRPSESVDIESCIEGGFDVGWIRQGEWIEYSIDVQTPGHYRVESRLAAQTGGGTFHLAFNGVNRTGTITAPITGGWQTWTTVNALATLPANATVMRFVNDSSATGQFNVNWFRFVLLAAAGDVNADQSVDIDDLYDLEKSGAANPYPDVDLNGIAANAADRDTLRATLRQNETQPQ